MANINKSYLLLAALLAAKNRHSRGGVYIQSMRQYSRLF